LYRPQYWLIQGFAAAFLLGAMMKIKKKKKKRMAICSPPIKITFSQLAYEPNESPIKIVFSQLQDDCKPKYKRKPKIEKDVQMDFSFSHTHETRNVCCPAEMLGALDDVVGFSDTDMDDCGATEEDDVDVQFEHGKVV
jgi:hypothetical protein